MFRRLQQLAFVLGIVAIGSTAWAGMPAALPDSLPAVLHLNAEPHERFQAISFFLLGLLVSAAIFQQLWNVLARDFSRLPRLTYCKSIAFVVLWGLIFVIVLTMISGARELMTPGAWKKKGITYRLEAPETSAMPPAASGETNHTVTTKSSP